MMTRWWDEHCKISSSLMRPTVLMNEWSASTPSSDLTIWDVINNLQRQIARVAALDV